MEPIIGTTVASLSSTLSSWGALRQVLGGTEQGLDATTEPDGNIIIRRDSSVSKLPSLPAKIRAEPAPDLSAPEGGEVVRIPAASVQQVKRDFTRTVMQVVVSVTLLAAGVYFLITGGADIQKAAAGWIGVVAGYWLS